MADTYRVQEKGYKAKTWRTCHIHSYGNRAPRGEAHRFLLKMRDLYGSRFQYRMVKNKR